MTISTFSNTNTENLPMFVKACSGFNLEKLEAEINKQIAMNEDRYVVHDIKYSVAATGGDFGFSALLMFVYTGEE